MFIATLIKNKFARKISNYYPLIAFCFYVSLSYISYRILFHDNDTQYYKNSIFQFIAHTFLFGLSIAIISGLRFNNKIFFVNLFNPIIFAALIHLLIFFFDYTQFTKDITNQALLYNFRMWGQVNDKASGFMSEASTYGVFGAIYSILIFEIGKYFFGIKKIIIYLLSATLIFTTIIISSKTGLVVFFIIWMFMYCKHQLTFLAIPLIALVGFYYVDQHAMFDLNNNLSSAMRFGSSLVALQAWIDTNWIIGIGPGQFHFEYILNRFPSFLYLSDEALGQSSPYAPYRASTYSLPVRLLVEIGLIGTIVAIYSLYKIYIRKPNWIAQQNNRFFKIIFLGSLAFLFSQDTYFYPMFIFSLSGILATTNNKR